MEQGTAREDTRTRLARFVENARARFSQEEHAEKLPPSEVEHLGKKRDKRRVKAVVAHTLADAQGSVV